MALGSFWLDQEEYLQAGHCFINAAKIEISDAEIDSTYLRTRKDALTLAALTLFVKSKDEKQQWQYIPRGEQNKDCEEKKLLTNDDCKILTANLQEFYERLKHQQLLPKKIVSKRLVFN
jgi:hypothetical protein